MAKPISFNKRENEKKKAAKRQEKQKRKEERKMSGTSSMDDMIAYVDENGNITSTPPEERPKEAIKLEDIAVSTPKKEDMGEDESSALKGRVEHFNPSKGYGFIKNLNNTDKYFFHISNAPQNINEGNIVTFETERGPKGMNAVNIQLDAQ